ncbi:hypothetical protein MAJ_10129, partial [Metarhizium majus ARSEF 297]
MLFVGDTLEETTTKASTAITAMEIWGQQEAFSFNPDKTKIMHFSRKRNSSSPPVSHQGKEIKAQKAMRWLGVWLDRRLTFNTHIEKWSLKAEKVISQLREVFDAEIHGALEGLKCAVLANFTNKPITVYMDNTSVIDCIGATALNFSQAQFRAF